MQQKENLTQEQKILLKEMSMNEDKVESGDLSPWQWEVVNQFNYAKEYLHSKYPDYEFTFTKCSPKNLINSQTNFDFRCNGIEHIFNMYMDVAEGEDGNVYKAIDNFYGYLLKPKAESYIKDICEGCLDGFRAATVAIRQAEGEEFNQYIDVETITTRRLSVNMKVTLYVKAESTDTNWVQSILSLVENEINERKLFGSYYVYFYDEIPDDVQTAAEFGNFNEKHIVDKPYVKMHFVCEDK